ncbi:hypothetical protein ACEZDB_26935 [Streptacidiphilus sp. N1-3]|uniref:Uncharacterized protein n=1 Tax=Streptacidiphilus alkalitolerans TaxID=3342712 RepID=A0ABV6X7J6_9ACTN
MKWLRRAAARIYDGSIQIGWRVGRWPWQDPHKGEQAVRTVLLAAAVAVLWWVGQAVPRVAGIALVAWAVAAFRAGEAEEEAAGEEAGDGAGEQLVPAPTRADLLADLVDTITQLAGTGRGVHLSLVYRNWLDRGLIRDERTLSQFRRFAEDLGVPVRDSLKVAGKVGIGVRLDDLPDVPATPPPTGDRHPFQGR